jgi:hypothetical protein
VGVDRALFLADKGLYFPNAKKLVQRMTMGNAVH